MVKPSKILKKALSGSKNIRFDELIALLHGFGFRLDRISGSHHIFLHPQLPQRVSIQPVSNGQAKPYQVRQLLKLIEEFELKLVTDVGDEE